MSTYTFTCNMGHEPAVMSVQADSDDAALAAMMPKAKEHLASVHPEMKMTDEEMMNMIKGGWTKSEA